MKISSRIDLFLRTHVRADDCQILLFNVIESCADVTAGLEVVS